MARGEDLYHLDEGALAGLDADLVVTQDLCAVCAVDVSVVDDALAHLGCTAEVLTIDPHTLDEVFASILTLGRATGRGRAGGGSWWRRCAPGWTPCAARVAGRPRPRVMLLEWTDPPFAPGHWVPEMIEAAGGEPLLGTAGRDVACASPGRRCTPPPRTSWSPRPAATTCAGATALADELVASGVLPAGVPVHPVDANAAWARPGTRLVDGVEELAALLHPR